MEIGIINKEALKHFGSLLLPEAVSMLEQGQPLLALGITEENTACGAAAGWLKGDVLEVRSLYVAPDHRCRGGGRLLLETMAKLAEKFTGSLSISYTATLPEHEALAPFLTALGFVEHMTDETIYRISVAGIGKSPFFCGNSQSAGVVPFEELSAAMLTEVYKREAAAGENYLETPLTDDSVDKRVSCAILEGGRIRSFAAVTATAPERVTLAWVKSAQPQDMPVMLRGAFGKLSQLYTPDTTLTIQAVNSASARLITTLIPAAEVISHTFTRSASV